MVNIKNLIDNQKCKCKLAWLLGSTIHRPSAYLSTIEYRKGNVMTKNKIVIVIFNTKINNISEVVIQIAEKILNS